MCNAYRRFVQGFAKVSAPLTAMLKKGTPSECEALTDDQYESFQTLKDKILNPPILALPKPNRPFVLDTDDCDVQLGCALLQEQDSPKDYRPIGYWSRTLTSADRNYSTTEKECLSSVWSILTLRADDGPQNYTEADDLMGKVQSENTEVKKNEVDLLDWNTVPPNSVPPQVYAIAPEEKEILLITIEELLKAQVEDDY
ncbi:unnamed protein product [Agarophyton chilense]